MCPRLYQIDYYGPQNGSKDPSAPEKTARVLTIMRADEYCSLQGGFSVRDQENVFRVAQGLAETYATRLLQRIHYNLGLD
jgi:hypothetical protein